MRWPSSSASYTDIGGLQRPLESPERRTAPAWSIHRTGRHWTCTNPTTTAKNTTSDLSVSCLAFNRVACRQCTCKQPDHTVLSTQQAEQPIRGHQWLNSHFYRLGHKRDIFVCLLIFYEETKAFVEVVCVCAGLLNNDRAVYCYFTGIIIGFTCTAHTHFPSKQHSRRPEASLGIVFIQCACSNLSVSEPAYRVGLS